MRARRMRAVICFQSVIFCLHCNSGTPHRPANSVPRGKRDFFLPIGGLPIDAMKFTQYSSLGPLGGD